MIDVDGFLFSSFFLLVLVFLIVMIWVFVLLGRELKVVVQRFNSPYLCFFFFFIIFFVNFVFIFPLQVYTYMV